MWAWFRAWLRRPGEIEEEAVALTGLAAEASMLLAAYEGMRGSNDGLVLATRAFAGRLNARSIAATEAELDAAERGRWMSDANDWANRAVVAIADGDDPYRETPRPNDRLREAGSRVRQAVRADLDEHVAAALGEYVAWVRAGGPSIDGPQ